MGIKIALNTKPAERVLLRFGTQSWIEKTKSLEGLGKKASLEL